MPLPNEDPSNPSLPAPLFADVDAVRGDQLRAFAQLIWENEEYLNEGQNINDAAAKASPVIADRIPLMNSTSSFALNYTTLEALRDLLTPPGSYLQHAGAAAPAGYLACNAAAVSRETYANLFAVIGTTYGVGDGSTTFNLPDARGLVMVGAGANGTMMRANATPFNGGAVGASRNDQVQGFKVQASGSNLLRAGSGTTAVGGVQYTGIDAGDVLPVDDGANGTPRTGDETRPAEIAVLVCIKY